MRDFFLRAGTTPQMDSDKKLAIRVSNFFAFWSVCTIAFMAIYVYASTKHPVSFLFLGFIVLDCLAFWLNCKHFPDIGRPILHLTGLATIFFGVDSLGVNSGYTMYYLVNSAIPFLIFSMREQKKSIVLSLITIIVYMLQLKLGDGLFFSAAAELPANKWVASIGSILFLLLVFIVFRWEMILAQKDIEKQQAELVHNSNLMALGEMSAGIAHEINNPLQTLSLHNEALRRYFGTLDDLPEKIQSHFQVIDRTIEKISVLIRGLKELARDASNDKLQVFSPQTVLDDVKNVTFERIKYLGIDFKINYNSNSEVSGQMVHLSQTLINLLNNSIDALEFMSEKWIHIEAVDVDNFVRITVTDSGKGIPPELLHKIMRPFFTTKGPGKGTGLGLSISKSIIEKNGGRFYYDSFSANTRFVLELPSIK